MKLIQLVGRYAGEEMEVSHDVGLRMLRQGTARKPGDVQIQEPQKRRPGRPRKIK